MSPSKTPLRDCEFIMEKLCARVQDFTLCNSALVQVAVAYPCDALESLWACVFAKANSFYQLH